MGSTRDSSENTDHRSGSRTFIIIAVVIIVSILAFLILRPNPSGSTPTNNPAAPTANH